MALPSDMNDILPPLKASIGITTASIFPEQVGHTAIIVVPDGYEYNDDGSLNIVYEHRSNN